MAQVHIFHESVALHVVTNFLAVVYLIIKAVLLTCAVILKGLAKLLEIVHRYISNAAFIGFSDCYESVRSTWSSLY